MAGIADPLRRRMMAAILAEKPPFRPVYPSEVTGHEGFSRPPDTYTRGTLLPAARNNRTGEIGLAVPQAALDAWEAVKLPGDVLAGRVDPNSPQGFERIMGLAGLASGGGLATRAIPGSLGMGARRPAKPGAPAPALDAGRRRMLDILEQKRIKVQAKALQKEFGTKNRIHGYTPRSKRTYDLTGADHFDKPLQQDIPTPHLQTYPLNEKALPHLPPKYNTGRKHMKTSPMTFQNLREARRLIGDRIRRGLPPEGLKKK